MHVERVNQVFAPAGGFLGAKASKVKVRRMSPAEIEAAFGPEKHETPTREGRGSASASWEEGAITLPRQVMTQQLQESTP
jgi:hypothetical protein